MVSISEIMLFAIADVCTLLSVSQNTMSLIEMTVIRYTKTWMAWLIWRKLTVVLYDLNIPLSLTSEVYEAVVRPVLRHGRRRVRERVQSDDIEQQEDDWHHGD